MYFKRDTDLFSIHFLNDVLTISISQSTALVKFMFVWRQGKEMFSGHFFFYSYQLTKHCQIKKSYSYKLKKQDGYKVMNIKILKIDILQIL